ncbi:MAG: hypothetical protein ACLQUY_11535 [Ktedonobacterales bacterium]
MAALSFGQKGVTLFAVIALVANISNISGVVFADIEAPAESLNTARRI